MNLTDQHEIVTIMAELESLGLFARYCHWTNGYSAGAFRMGPAGWIGEMGNPQRTAVEAWRMALDAGRRIAVPEPTP